MKYIVIVTAFLLIVATLVSIHISSYYDSHQNDADYCSVYANSLTHWDGTTVPYIPKERVASKICDCYYILPYENRSSWWCERNVSY